MKKLFGFLLSIVWLPVFSQQTYDFRQLQDVKVVVAGDTLLNAWAGGLNAPVFSKIHLNHDNVEDLYVFDHQCSKSYTFLADNSSGTWKWKYAPEYEVLFPAELKYWVLLRDYDNDGRKDIFTNSNGNIKMYRNLTPLNGVPVFAPPRVLKFGTVFNKIPVDQYFLPHFGDADGDGDLDIMAFNTGSVPVSIRYFRNQSKELFNHADSLKFTKVTDIFGSFQRCADFTHTYTFGQSGCRVGGINHVGASSLLVLDLDADGDKDLLIGLESNPNLVRFRNSGNSLAPAFTPADTTFRFPGHHPVKFNNFPAAYFEDVTFDGKNDLLAAPFMHDNSELGDVTHSSWLYRNDAFAPGAAPVFTFQKNDFLQDDMIDVGESAAPAFFDIDSDGDQDLLVSNYADFRTGSFKSTVSLFSNIGTPTKPLFKLTDTDFLSFSAAGNNAGYKGIKLQFGDMDGNGTRDLIIRYIDASGSLAKVDFIPNSGQPGNLFNTANQVGVAIPFILNATDAPFFYDLDGDGDLDMLMGTEQASSGNGVLWYVRRVGADATQFSSWDKNFNTNVGNIQQLTNPSYFNPVIADLNNDNVPELLTTDHSGVVRVYQDILTNLNGNPAVTTGILYNNLTNQPGPTALGNVEGWVYSRVNLHMAAADLDGDNQPELVIGTLAGGLVYLKNQTVLGLPIELPVKKFTLSIFPNPASQALQISSEEPVTLSFFDATGKEVLAQDSGFKMNYQLDVSGLKNGIYFLKAVTKELQTTGRTVVVQH